MKRTLVTSLFAVAAVALSACGGSGGGPTAVPPTNARHVAAPSGATPSSSPSVSAPAEGNDASSPPCNLLTAADIATVTGSAMTMRGTDGRVSCTYLSADNTKQFAVMIMADRHAMELLLSIEASSEHIAGLGDDAFWSAGTIIFVRVGDRAFELTSPSLLDPSNIDAGKAGMTLLATHALAKFR
jgi:hypothetical protein